MPSRPWRAAADRQLCGHPWGSGLAPPHTRASGETKPMLKFAAAFAVSAAFMTSAAFAQIDTMQTAYGNTVVVTEPSGSVLRYHFNADHTFDVALPDGHNVPGTYQIANGEICLTYATRAEAECAEHVTGKNVGDTWTQRSSSGDQITVSLQAGR